MITMKFKEAKQIIREYFRTAYSDDTLAEFLEYTRAGKLQYTSCCCVVGFPLRPAGAKPLELDQTMGVHDGGVYHVLSQVHPEWEPISNAFYWLGSGSRRGLWGLNMKACDALRRRILIPMIKAEIKRRIRTEQQLGVTIR